MEDSKEFLDRVLKGEEKPPSKRWLKRTIRDMESKHSRLSRIGIFVMIPLTIAIGIVIFDYPIMVAGFAIPFIYARKLLDHNKKIYALKKQLEEYE
ncbi:MAG: hypothetical protein R6U44_02830 [Archaeoglobaceae archaeon]